MATVEQWIKIGSATAGFALLCSRLPDRVHDEVRHFITRWTPLVAAYFNPYVQITFSEYSSEHFRRNKLFDSIAAYLGEECKKRARKLKAEHGKDSKDAQLTLDQDMEVTDDFGGARLWWRSFSNYRAPVRTRGSAITLLPAESEPRNYRLVFHKRHSDLMIDDYLPHILEIGQKLIAKKRQRRLFTNYQGKGACWCHVPFEHPATFNHLAMDPVKKKEIIDDLKAFQEGKDDYSKFGKAWKRGYLLFGPPGTGKSTLISAMSELLDYDVYDLDLTSVKGNVELRKLFIETTGKSIIVIEDIDAIDVDPTTKRKDKNAECNCKGDDEKLPIQPHMDDKRKVTLSGLLSFVDGLWSACGGERIIVFTTNHVDRLDPALTRRGRMDMLIEMSYCRFEAFKVLANNYLSVTDHRLFGEIRRLLDEIDMSPADVADNLMPKSNKRKRDADECLHEYWDECLAGLVENLKKAKKDSAASAMEETIAQGEARKGYN